MSEAEPITARNRTTDGGTRRNAGPLHGKQERAVRVLVGGGSITDAAREAGVRRATVSEWVNRNSEFQAELRRQQGDLRKAVRMGLESAAGDAVKVLHDLLEDPSARTRLLAAKAILGCVADLTVGSDATAKPGDVLPAFEATLRYSGAAERERLEQFATLPSQEREVMRQLLDRLSEAARSGGTSDCPPRGDVSTARG